MTEEKRQEFLQQNRQMAGRALRVLAAAERPWQTLPQARAETLEQELCFIGLAGMIDRCGLRCRRRSAGADRRESAQ